MSEDIHMKPLLDLKEASQYFHINAKKLRSMANGECDGYFIKNGNKWLVKRVPFEKYLLSKIEI